MLKHRGRGVGQTFRFAVCSAIPILSGCIFAAQVFAADNTAKVEEKVRVSEQEIALLKQKIARLEAMISQLSNTLDKGTRDSKQGWLSGGLEPSGTATADSVKSGATFYSGGSWSQDTGTAVLAVADSVKLGVSNAWAGTGTLLPSGGDATLSDVVSGKTFYGASQTDWTLKTGTRTDTTAASTDPGVTNVKSGINYNIDGSPKTGTLTVQECRSLASGYSATGTCQAGAWYEYPRKISSSTYYPIEHYGGAGDYDTTAAQWCIEQGFSGGVETGCNYSWVDGYWKYSGGSWVWSGAQNLWYVTGVLCKN